MDIFWIYWNFGFWMRLKLEKKHGIWD
jgi:hypothetical protein